MNVVFVSNYFTHHQKPFSDAMYKATNGHYTFIGTQEMDDERKKLGWGGIEKPVYVKETDYKDKAKWKSCQAMIDEADVVIQGSIYDAVLKDRLKKGKLTFIYTERPYKSISRYLKLPINIYKKVTLRKAYILCAGGYVARDYALIRSNMGKMYKWGYFPVTRLYDSVETVIGRKEKNTIVWAGRFIDWKHPELAVELAHVLKKDGYDFKLNIIGTGPLENRIKSLISSYGLKNQVNMMGVRNPDEVRYIMEKSAIHLFTSDQNEGWGAVLNESMNSACAVIANNMIGSVPFLIKGGENGLVYKNGDLVDLCNKVKWIIDNPMERIKISMSAYRTIVDEWNAENASDKFLSICNKLSAKNPNPFESEGVCSSAKII